MSDRNDVPDPLPESLPEVFAKPSVARARFADLDCIVIDGGPAPRIPVVLCHGYGAPGHDLAGLSFEWLDQLGDHGGLFRFVFPSGPISLADQGMPDGRAWWPLNMARLLEMAGASRFDELHDEEPPGLSDARKQLTAAILEILASMNLRADGSEVRWALGGFSQGAMLTLDTVLHGEIPSPTVLLQYSGTLICRSIWQTQLSRLANCRVLQSHGRIDPILPFDSALRLETLLREADIEIEFHAFDGPHTIDPETVRVSAAALKSLGIDKASEAKPRDGASLTEPSS